MADPLSLQDALAQGPSYGGWPIEDIRQTLSGRYLPKNQREHLEGLLRQHQEAEGLKIRKESLGISRESSARQARGEDRTVEALNRKMEQEDAPFRALRNKRKSEKMWSVPKGMQYNLKTVLGGGAESVAAWKGVPKKHRDLLIWGQQIARGQPLTTWDGKKTRRDADYSMRARAKIDALYDEYLAKVKSGGRIVLRNEQGESISGKTLFGEPVPHRSSSFGNPFGQGGVDEGGFMHWAARKTGLPPLVIGSYRRHRMSDLEQKRTGEPDTQLGVSLFDEPEELTRPINEELYDQLYDQSLKKTFRRFNDRNIMVP